MPRRSFSVVFLLGIVSVTGMPFTSPIGAETLVEQNVETRVSLALFVPQTEVQKWLPAPWQVNPFSSGPSKGANLILMFRDRELILDGEGKPVSGGHERGLVLLIPAKHVQTGESSLYLVRVFTADPQLVPGAYKNSVLATVRWEQSLVARDLDFRLETQTWEVRDKAGGMIDLRMQCQRAVPVRSKPESKMHGGPDPDFSRVYRIDRGEDVVKSIPAGVDRVRSYRLRVTMAELRSLFDGKEQLISITVLPWYMRQVFVP